MTLNDPLANALSRILAQEKIGSTLCVIKPVSSVIKQVLKIMADKKYVGSYSEVKDRKGNILKLTLTGCINKCGVVKPRFSVQATEYDKFEQRFLPAKGMGILIVSTPQGLMTNVEAKKQNLGGRLIAYCY